MKIEIHTPKFITRPFRFLTRHIGEWKRKLIRSLRVKLILTFAFCIVAGTFVSILSKEAFEGENTYAQLEYENGMDEIDNFTRDILLDYINTLNEDIKSGSKEEGVVHTQTDYLDNLQKHIEEVGTSSQKKILILDLDGKVLYKSSNAAETQVDIRNLISQAMESRNYYGNNRNYNESSQSITSYTCFYPIDLYNNQKAFLTVSGSPRADIVYHQRETSVPVIPGIITFLVLFWIMTKRKMNQIAQLADGLREIAKGNLNYRLKESGQDEIGSLATNINQMAVELQRKIEEERQAEKVKNELITNVSHDLRTPLTTIMGYLRLLLDRKYETDEQIEEYVKITYNKSEKLKRLIDDLFEYTKLTSPGVRLHKTEVCLNELVDQMVEETVPLSEEHELVFQKEVTKERVMVEVDADKIVRVLENLLTNAITYSTKPSEIRIALQVQDHHALVQIENQNQTLTPEDMPRLFERFYRADQARSADGGSGLGLAITKSIIELHGGSIWAEKEEDLVRFSFLLPL